MKTRWTPIEIGAGCLIKVPETVDLIGKNDREENYNLRIYSVTLKKVSHVKFDSDVKQNSVQEKIIAAKVEKFSDAVTLILRTEAAAKLKKLVYVFISVRQLTPAVFTYTVDDSRDKISAGAYAAIQTKFNEVFGVPG